MEEIFSVLIQKLQVPIKWGSALSGKYIHNVIKCIKNRDQTATNCSDILGELCEFYTRLYRSSKK